MSRFFQGQNVRGGEKHLFAPVFLCSPGCLAQTGTVVLEEGGR